MIAIQFRRFFNRGLTARAISYSYWKNCQKAKESTNNIKTNDEQNGVGTPVIHRTDIKL